MIAVVGCWGKCRRNCLSPCHAKPATFPNRVLTGRKGDTPRPERSCWCCSVEWISLVTGTAWTCSLISATAEYSQASWHWGASAVKEDNVGSKKGAARGGDAKCIAQVKQEWGWGTGDIDHEPGAAKCGWCKALDNPTTMLTVWWCTTRREASYMPYLQAVIICEDIRCPYPMTSHKERHTWHLYCLPYRV